MEQSGNMYVLNRNEYIKAKKLGAPGKSLQDVHVNGPCMIRLENEGDEDGIGHVLAVQIDFNRGKEYLLAQTIKDVVFQRK